MAAASLAALLALAGCGSVSVRPTAFKAAPRPPDCALDFFRHPPVRDYDELGEVFSYYPYVVAPQEALRAKACELGADAVIVTRDFLIATSRTPDRKLIAGVAIKYR